MNLLFYINGLGVRLILWRAGGKCGIIMNVYFLSQLNHSGNLSPPYFWKPSLLSCAWYACRDKIRTCYNLKAAGFFLLKVFVKHQLWISVLTSKGDLQCNNETPPPASLKGQSNVYVFQVTVKACSLLVI